MIDKNKVKDLIAEGEAAQEQQENKYADVVIPEDFKKITKRQLADKEFMYALADKCKAAFGETKNSKIYQAIDDYIFDKWEKHSGEDVDDVRDAIERFAETTTDHGNADRFLHDHKGEVKYIVEEMDWVYWNGERWKRDSKKTKVRGMLNDNVNKFGKAMKSLSVQARATMPQMDKNTEIALSSIKNWVRQSQNSRTVNSTLEALASKEDVAESILQFDSKGKFFGVENGVLNVETGRLINNDPKYLMLKSAPVQYDPEAKCPRFKQFLREVFENDAGKIDTIQEVLGSAMVGVTKDKFFIFLGGGSNGKTTLVSIINKVLGTADGDGYSITTSPRIFLDNQQNNTEYYMARLKGARLLYMSETEAVATLKDDLVKQVTPDNDEQVTARKVRGEVFEYSVVATPILLTNNKPRVKDMSDGMWRRLVLVKFNKHFTEEEKDRDLMSKLEEEKSGILNWCLEGAQRYMQNGRQIALSESIQHDIEMWKNNEDAVSVFWDEKFVKFVGRNTPLKDIKGAWDSYIDEYGGGKYSAQWLRRQLENRGVVFEQTGSGGLPCAMGWASIKSLTKDERREVTGEAENVTHLSDVFPKL